MTGMVILPFVLLALVVMGLVMSERLRRLVDRREAERVAVAG